jgi:DNA-binding CsgD family transcriptional regulator
VSTQRPTVDDTDAHTPSLDDVRQAIERRVDDPTITFPDDWTTSSSWKRAQTADVIVGIDNPAQFSVMLSRPDATPDLGCLSPAQRAVYRRVEHHGAMPSQVAHERGIDASTARTHLQRARRKLDAQPPVWGDRHRVTFALHDHDLVAECDCEAHRWHDWCAHVAVLWWRWTGTGDLVVTDLDTGQHHQHPPEWLSVDDATATTDTTHQQARTDGGEPR